jgi:lipoprotein NlpD
MKNTRTVGLISYLLHGGLLLFLLAILCSCSSSWQASEDEFSADQAPLPQYHTVSKGETLYAIAFRYGLSFEQIAQINHISYPYTIFPGQRLHIKSSNGETTDKALAGAGSGAHAGRKQSTAAESANADKKASQSAERAAESNIKWQWPANGAVIAGFADKGKINKGLDIAGKKGDAVYAAADGKVVYSGSGLVGYGNLIIVKHNAVFISAYAHNDQILVKEGGQVKVGQKIAEIGSSGANRNTLHFEIRRGGNPVDPRNYLPRK